LIELGRIIPDPDQPRKEFIREDHDQFVASLRSTGQIQPITVRWDPQASRYMLITGERRFRAATEAGQLEVLDENRPQGKAHSLSAAKRAPATRPSGPDGRATQLALAAPSDQNG